MKRLKNIIGMMVAIAAICLFSACGSGESPVDKYLNLLDEAAEKAENISSYKDLLNNQDIISREDALEIVKENADYPLTKSDKEKLKKSYGRLLRIAYKKTADFGGLSEKSKKQVESQIDLFIAGADATIDQAKTLGDLMGLR